MPGQQIHEAKKAAFERRLAEERAAEEEVQRRGFVARPMPDSRSGAGFEGQGQGQSSFQAKLGVQKFKSMKFDCSKCILNPYSFH